MEKQRKSSVFGRLFMLVFAIVASICVMNNDAMAADTTSADGKYTYTTSGNPKVVTITAYLGNETSVVVPSQIDDMNVTKINYFKTSDDYRITSISIPSTVTSISTYGLEKLHYLSKITVDAGNTSYSTDNNVLMNVAKTSIYYYPEGKTDSSYTIPETVTYVNADEFVNDRLKTITMGKNVSSIAGTFNYKLTHITSIVVNNSTKFKTVGGILYSTDGTNPTTLICYPRKKTGTTYTVPATVTSISSYAFYNSAYINNVTISKSVTKLGSSTFENSESIKKIVFATGSTITEIPGYMCRNSINLTSINIPSTVTEIGYFAFYNCSKITAVKLPDSLKTIESYAFQKCESLTTITLPAKITKVQYYSFYGCSSLKSVYFKGVVTAIDGSAFYECTSLTTIDTKNVETMSSWAFAYCTKLAVVDTGKVSSFGSGTFAGCKSLKNVKIISGVTSIPSSMFSDCKMITAVNLPDSVTSIGSSAFNSASSLKTISLGKVQSIDNYTFYGCTSLASITIPATVASIGSSAFKYSGITSITIPATVTSMGNSTFEYCESLKSAVINASISSINYMFDGCTNLVSVKIAEGTTSGTYAFRNCYRLKSVVLPNSITAIDSGMFSGCSSLVSAPISNNIRTIYASSFNRCISLKSIKIPDNVATVYGDAFLNCTGITSVSIGKNTHIYSNAFVGCTALAKIILNENNGFHKCVDNVLYSKDMDEIVTYALGKTATSYTMPSQVTFIGDDAFHGAVRLKNISISKKLSSIGDDAFAGCRSLTAISLPSTLEYIGNGAFSGCTGIKTIVIPENVTEIGYSAFGGCTSLTTISGMAGVEYMEGIFIACKSLKSINVSTSNRYYKSVNGVLYNKTMTTLVKMPSVKKGHFYVPATVNQIYYDAFEGSKLTFVGVNKYVNDAGFYNAPPILSYNNQYVYDAAISEGTKAYKACINISSYCTSKLGTTTYTYTGKAKKPSVTVTFLGEKLINGVDYTVKYSNNVKVGAATVTITGKGYFTGTKKFTYKILPGKVTSVKATSKVKKKAVIAWKKLSGISGYKVYRYNASTKKWSCVKTTTSTKFTDVKRTSGKKYSYKVRAYKKVGSKIYYGTYSSKVTVRIK